MSKDPLETEVSAGLAKIHRASELVTEGDVEELTTIARRKAELTRKQHLDKPAQQGVEPKDPTSDPDRQ